MHHGILPRAKLLMLAKTRAVSILSTRLIPVFLQMYSIPAVNLMPVTHFFFAHAQHGQYLPKHQMKQREMHFTESKPTRFTPCAIGFLMNAKKQNGQRKFYMEIFMGEAMVYQWGCPWSRAQRSNCYFDCVVIVFCICWKPLEGLFNGRKERNHYNLKEFLFLLLNIKKKKWTFVK